MWQRDSTDVSASPLHGFASRCVPRNRNRGKRNAHCYQECAFAGFESASCAVWLALTVSASSWTPAWPSCLKRPLLAPVGATKASLKLGLICRRPPTRIQSSARTFGKFSLLAALTPSFSLRPSPKPSHSCHQFLTPLFFGLGLHSFDLRHGSAR